MSSAVKTAGKANKAGNKTRLSEKTKKYKADLEQAFNAGYSAGWNDHDKIPDRFGARSAAIYGYGKGLRNHKRTSKYQKKVGK